jgi:hypothetical protein
MSASTGRPRAFSRRAWLAAVAAGPAMAAFAAPAEAQLDRLFKGLGGGAGSGLSDAKIGSGLKEALQIGTEKATLQTGTTDGFFLNQAIKILMPSELRTFERGLRTVGYGPQIDEFVLSMNRAAERAAPQAKEIFWGAIGDMTFDDARKIWSGPDNAATMFFKDKTTGRLTTAFTPIVDSALGEVGVTRQYKDLVGRFEQIPFMQTQSFDLTRYVTGKGLDGLFHVVGEQEKQIRTNPAARTTELLRDVFGK